MNVRSLVRWTWGITFFVAGLRPFVWAVGNYWAAGTPRDDPAWHESWEWGNAFAIPALAAWAVAGAGIWLMRPRK